MTRIVKPPAGEYPSEKNDIFTQEESNTTSGMNSPANIELHTELLTSLTQRDIKALLELFDRRDAEEIQADINNQLQKMHPEPCWEEDPFEFLREYL
ncbi:MAG: hypothetical protein ACHBN1_38050 [Heteroscytonema crispum UTEX LB 1556]